LLTYIPIIITFIGAALGLTGSAWDSKKASYVKLTARGWLSLTVLLIGLVLSVYSTYRTKQINSYEACQRTLVKKLAYQDISYSFSVFIEPFADMYKAETNVSLDIRDPKSIDTLVTDLGLKIFKDTNLYKKPTSDVNGFNDEDYADSFSRISDSAPLRLKEIVKTYSFYLDGEDIVWIDNISNEWNRMSFDNLPDNRKTVGVLYLDDDRIQDLKGFLLSLKMAWSKVYSQNADRNVLVEQGCK
jgi:hypothetical protein